MSAFPDRVLVLDDERIVRDAVSSVLERSGYSCTQAATVSEARTLLSVEKFDLIICDLRLGRDDGLMLISETANLRPDTAILVVSAIDDQERGLAALNEGAFNYLIKPFHPTELLFNVASTIRHKRELLAVDARRSRIESLHESSTSELLETTSKLREAEREALMRLATVAELRDADTGAHVGRVGCLCAKIARAFGFDDETCGILAEAAPLHDIGKVAIPDSILLKAGELDAEERSRMQEHTRIGHDLLAGSNVPALQMGATLALTHHERYCGGGYPHQLRGDEIPVVGRIAAIADVYDALTSDRPYREALDHETAIAIMTQQRWQFDPEIFDVFLTDIAPTLALVPA